MHAEAYRPLLSEATGVTARFPTGHLVQSSPFQLSVGPLTVFIFINCEDLLIEIMEMTVLLILLGGRGCI